jgi:excisionase family DNA binding protein
MSSAPFLVHLPEPVGWIALTPEALREAQLRASEVIGVGKRGDEPSTRAQQAEYVSAEEAARALGVEPSWLLRRARMRKLPFLKVGKYCRFSVEAVSAHLTKAATK